MGGKIEPAFCEECCNEGGKCVEQLLTLGRASSAHMAVAFWTLRFLYWQSCNSVVQDESQQKNMNYRCLHSL